jgi:hypothetical protein
MLDNIVASGADDGKIILSTSQVGEKVEQL